MFLTKLQKLLIQHLELNEKMKKSRYQVRQVLVLLCKLVATALGLKLC